VLLPETSFLLVLTWVAARVAVLITVAAEPAVTLLVVLDDAIAAECLGAVLEAVVFAVQLIQHGVQHLHIHSTCTPASPASS